MERDATARVRRGHGRTAIVRLGLGPALTMVRQPARRGVHGEPIGMPTRSTRVIRAGNHNPPRSGAE